MRLSRRAAFDLLAVCVALACYAWLIAPARVETERGAVWLLFDDPMISMRYARNFAEGHGLTWNPGDAPVEGFSNPLWTAFMAALHLALPHSVVPLAVILTGAALLVWNAFACRRLAAAAGADEVGARVALVAALFCAPLAYWTLRGFEVGLASALYAWGAACAWRRRPAAGSTPPDPGEETAAPVGGGTPPPRLLGVLLGTLVLLRADGAVLAAALWVVAGVLAPRERRVKELGFLALWPAIALLASTGARLWYYGDIFPNTYYLKMTGGTLLERVSRGWDVLWSSLDAMHFVVVGLAVVALSDREAARKPRVTLFMLWAAGAAYSAFAGGDAWEQFRFPNRYLSTTLTPLLALTAVGIASIPPRAGRRTLIVLASLAAGVACAMVWSVWEGVPAKASLLDTRASNWTYWIMQGLPASLLVGLGFAAWSRCKRGATVPAPEPGPSHVLLCSLIALVTLSCGVNVILKRASGLMPYIESEAHLLRIGAVFERHTKPDARIGVSWAGLLPYHLERRYSDLLGKCDREIAHQPHHRDGRFIPGHTKWDIEYTIRHDHPDLLLDAKWMDDSEEGFLRANGYDNRFEYFWVLSDSARISEELKAVTDLDDATLTRLLSTPPTYRH